MSLKFLNKVLVAHLLDTAGGGDGGGSGGAGSLLTPSGGGSGAPAGAGDAGAASGADSGKPAGDAGTGDGAKGGGTADWRSQLPKELQEDATLKKYTSVSALAGAYLNAQKLIGADKIAIPGKHATEEDWKNVYKKLGVPEKVDEYQVKFKEGVSIDEKFSKSFREFAHSKGILPSQAQALADWFSDVNAGSEAEIANEQKQQFAKTVETLKKDWGNSFDLQVARANKVIQEAGGDELAQHFATLGLGGDAKVMKFLAKVGEDLYGEHKFVEGQGGASTLTPKEIDAKIASLTKESAYFEKTHPNHKAVVAEVQDLFKLKYPIDKK